MVVGTIHWLLWWWMLHLSVTVPMASLSFVMQQQSTHNERARTLNSNILFLANDEEQHHRNNNDNNQSSYGLYVHIPYCRRRCNYCDFAIVPVGPKVIDEDNPSSAIRSTGFAKIDVNYRRAILKEIDVISKTSDGDRICLRSIYFGGGTPSLC